MLYNPFLVLIKGTKFPRKLDSKNINPQPLTIVMNSRIFCRKTIQAVETKQQIPSISLIDIDASSFMEPLPDQNITNIKNIIDDDDEPVFTISKKQNLELEKLRAALEKKRKEKQEKLKKRIDELIQKRNKKNETLIKKKPRKNQLHIINKQLDMFQERFKHVDSFGYINIYENFPNFDLNPLSFRVSKPASQIVKRRPFMPNNEQMDKFYKKLAELQFKLILEESAPTKITTEIYDYGWNNTSSNIEDPRKKIKDNVKIYLKQRQYPSHK